MAAVRLVWCFSLLCAAAIFVHVNGIVTTKPNYDLKLVSVSRTVYDDDIYDMSMEVILQFTASVKPAVEWTRSSSWSELPIANATVEYGADGRGRALARISLDKFKSRLTVKIGYFDAHYFQLSIGWQYLELDNASRTLNAQLSPISTGYDIVYSGDETFDVVAAVNNHVAPGYTLRNFSGKYDVRVDASYVDQETGTVKSSFDSIDTLNTEKFLQVQKVFAQEMVMLALQFRTSEEDISGFFRIIALSDYDDEDAPWFVDDIWEVAYISIHNSSTPGPFPRDYAYVRTRYNEPETCWSDESCSIYCYGFANNIVDAKIYKEEEGELKELSGVDVTFENSHYVMFDAEIDTSADFERNYVCKITTNSNQEASRTVEVQDYTD